MQDGCFITVHVYVLARSSNIETNDTHHNTTTSSSIQQQQKVNNYCTLYYIGLIVLLVGRYEPTEDNIHIRPLVAILDQPYHRSNRSAPTMSLAFERTASSRNVASNNGAGTPTINRRLYANGIPLPTQTLTAPKNGDSSLPTSCQVIALNFCYRRLLFVLACCPLACVIAPVVLNLMLWVLSFASVDLAIFMTWMWDRSLKFAAPSPEKLALARKKNQWKLPLLMFGFSCAIIRFSNLLLDMIAGAMVTKSFGQRFRPHISTIHFSRLNAPMTPLGSGLRPALGLSLIGLAILLRFVGGISIGTCFVL